MTVEPSTATLRAGAFGSAFQSGFKCKKVSWLMIELRNLTAGFHRNPPWSVNPLG
jgi:hypothetical protein